MKSTGGRQPGFLLRLAAGTLPLIFLPLLAQTPDGAAALNQEGSELLQQGRVAQALEKFRAATELTPEDPAIQFNVGLALFRLGQYGEALVPLEKSLGYEPSVKQARYLRGVIYFQMSEFEACAGELEHVRGDRRYGEQALYMLVESNRKSGNARGSQTAFVELEQRYPDSAFLHKLMGMAYEARNYDEKAVEEFRAALRAQPRMPDVAFGIGYIYFKQQNHDEARQWMAQELALQPCYARAHHYLGEIARAEPNLEEAASRYRKALQCDANLADAYIGLGMIHERQRRFEDAVKMFHQAVRVKPEDSQAHYKLGLALRRTGHVTEAQAEFRLAKQMHAASEKKAKEAMKAPQEPGKLR